MPDHLLFTHGDGRLFGLGVFGNVTLDHRSRETSSENISNCSAILAVIILPPVPTLQNTAGLLDQPCWYQASSVSGAVIGDTAQFVVTALGCHESAQTGNGRTSCSEQRESRSHPARPVKRVAAGGLA